MKQYLRHTNISRIAGLGMLIAGALFPVGPVPLPFNSGLPPTNMIQIAGFLLLMWPLIQEGARFWKNSRNPK